MYIRITHKKRKREREKHLRTDTCEQQSTENSQCIQEAREVIRYKS